MSKKKTKQKEEKTEVAEVSKVEFTGMVKVKALKVDPKKQHMEAGKVYTVTAEKAKLFVENKVAEAVK